MSRTTLKMILFLLANWRIVELLKINFAFSFEVEANADRTGADQAAFKAAAIAALRNERDIAMAAALDFFRLLVLPLRKRKRRRRREIRGSPRAQIIFLWSIANLVLKR